MKPRDIAAVRAHLAKVPSLDSMTLEDQRAQYERAETAFPVPADVQVDPITVRGVPAEWLTVRGDDPRAAVLYLHGGG